jgi:ribose/xylose/arabinose/galactoside ABC-type transport system permease subunit
MQTQTLSKAGGPVAPKQDLTNRLVLFAARYAIVIAFVLLLIGMSLASPYFLTSYNLLNVVRQAAPVLMVGVGMTFIMATGGIDLSVGSVVALTSVFCADLLARGVPSPLVALLMLALGGGIGLVNGTFVVLGLPSFVVTLASLTFVRGFAFVYSQGYAQAITNAGFKELGRGWIGPLPISGTLALIVAIGGYVLLMHTRLGRYMLAVGGREEAARVQGIRTGRVKMFAYVSTGVLAGAAGLVIASWIGNGSPNAGIGFELDVITPVVLGGTSLFGGQATIFGTVIGGLFTNFVRNGLNLRGVDPYWVQVVTGLILLFAVYFNTRVAGRLTEIARLKANREAER